MDDYISRQAAIDVLATMQGLCTSKTALVQNSKIWQQIKDLPSADVQPVRNGHWIIKDNPGTGWYRVTCSECGEDVTSVAPVIGFFPKAKVIWDFCPECGTRMDGE